MNDLTIREAVALQSQPVSESVRASLRRIKRAYHDKDYRTGYETATYLERNWDEIVRQIKEGG